MLDAFPSTSFSWDQKFCHSLSTGKLAGHQKYREHDHSQVTSSRFEQDLSVVTCTSAGPLLHREHCRGFFSYSGRKAIQVKKSLALLAITKIFNQHPEGHACFIYILIQEVKEFLLDYYYC